MPTVPTFFIRVVLFDKERFLFRSINFSFDHRSKFSRLCCLFAPELVFDFSIGVKSQRVISWGLIWAEAVLWGVWLACLTPVSWMAYRRRWFLQVWQRHDQVTEVAEPCYVCVMSTWIRILDWKPWRWWFCGSEVITPIVYKHSSLSFSAEGNWYSRTISGISIISVVIFEYIWGRLWAIRSI